jgi:predicted HAD superfamily Cof-like phosphohydrolase
MSNLLNSTTQEQTNKNTSGALPNKMTNFEKIKEFHKTFSHPCEEQLQIDVFEEKPKLVKLRKDLIDEEVKELHEAIEQHDMIETIDALTDILYVVYGAGTAMGIDLDKAFDIVHKSNMSKLCVSEKEAIETVDHYEKLYDTGETRYDSPVYELAPDGVRYIVFNKSTNKILKSINYTPAKFDELFSLTKKSEKK